MRVLIIGTTYEGCQERANLHDMWIKLHSHLNPDCDLLLVDSASPWRPSLAERHSDFLPIVAKHMLHVFPDNLGHFEHGPPGGRDGWGRALSFGLKLSIDCHYDYAVHIEGDSLCRLNIMDIAKRMQQEGANVVSTPAHGNTLQWVETGLMFFSVPYLRNSNLIGRYNWAARTPRPYTEEVLFKLFGSNLKQGNYSTCRCEGGHESLDFILQQDWITKCHDFRYYERFMEVNYT